MFYSKNNWANSWGWIQSYVSKLFWIQKLQKCGSYSLGLKGKNCQRCQWHKREVSAVKSRLNSKDRTTGLHRTGRSSSLMFSRISEKEDDPNYRWDGVEFLWIIGHNCWNVRWRGRRWRRRPVEACHRWLLMTQMKYKNWKGWSYLVSETDQSSWWWNKWKGKISFTLQWEK